jgi:hypothetical protein
MNGNLLRLSDAIRQTHSLSHGYLPVGNLARPVCPESFLASSQRIRPGAIAVRTALVLLIHALGMTAPMLGAGHTLSREPRGMEGLMPSGLLREYSGHDGTRDPGIASVPERLPDVGWQ